MATVAELEKQIADLNRQIKSAQGSRYGGLKEREEAAEFTRQLIQKAEAAGDQAKAEREVNVLSNILQEINATKQEIAGLEVQKDQLQQELNTQKAAEQSQQATTVTQQNNAQSAGAVVAASDDAGVVNPAKPPEKFTPDGRVGTNAAGTNADTTVTTNTAAGETLDNSPEKKITETQIPIAPPNAGEVKRVPNEPPPDPLSPPAGTYGAGVGAANDDATPTKNLKYY